MSQVTETLYNLNKTTLIMKFLLNVPRLLTCIMVTVLLMVVSCQKEGSNTSQAENEQFAEASSEADAEAETTFDDVFDNVMGVNAQVGIGGTGVFGQANRLPGEEIISGTNDPDSVINPCFKVTITSINTSLFPLRVVVDFGTGCLGRDGRMRKGKIITVYTGRLVNPGSVAETVFDGYYLNDVHVEGTHRVENKSTSNNWVFEVKVSNAKLSKPNGNYSQWNSTKTITQIEGNLTSNIALDDIFSIKGEANGSVKRDAIFFQWGARSVADNPIIKRFNCRWLVKGKIAMRRSNSDVAILDYGSGTCDAKATITINGVVREISLH